MTSFTPSRNDDALNKSGLGPVLYSFATHRDVRALGRSLVRARPACLDGGLPRLLPALAHGDFFIHRVLLYVLHLLFTGLANQDGMQPSSFCIVPVLPCRIEFSSCTICPPSLLRLRFFSIWWVKSKALTCVPLVMCIMADVWPMSPTYCRRCSQRAH